MLRATAVGWPVARNAGATANLAVVLDILEDGDFPISDGQDDIATKAWEGVGIGLEEAARELAVFDTITHWNYVLNYAVSTNHLSGLNYDTDAFANTEIEVDVPAADQLGAWALGVMFSWESDRLHTLQSSGSLSLSLPTDDAGQ